MNDKNLYFKDKKGNSLFKKLCEDCPNTSKQT